LIFDKTGQTSSDMTGPPKQNFCDLVEHKFLHARRLAEKDSR